MGFHRLRGPQNCWVYFRFCQTYFLCKFLHWCMCVVRRLREISKSDCSFRHVRLSVRTEQLGSHWTDFDETWYISCFLRSVEHIQVSLKCESNHEYFTRRLLTFMTIYHWILLRMRNVLNKSCRQNQNTHFMFSNFLRKSCYLWDNVSKNVAHGNIAARCMLH